ncbi:hypothetical protein G7Y79_00008g023100 [Physcia stellaris]|nr:hypothetical protein G7Y79_00008g023100 [Physcia stellaris]
MLDQLLDELCDAHRPAVESVKARESEVWRQGEERAGELRAKHEGLDVKEEKLRERKEKLKEAEEKLKGGEKLREGVEKLREGEETLRESRRSLMRRASSLRGDPGSWLAMGGQVTRLVNGLNDSHSIARKVGAELSQAESSATFLKNSSVASEGISDALNKKLNSQS